MAFLPGQVLDAFGTEFASISWQPDNKLAPIIKINKKNNFFVYIIMQKNRYRNTIAGNNLKFQSGVYLRTKT
ncbi:hypothetical protein [Nostoc sp.]|uniref:hypothetical protein n=1 Tax=Nostoc sp. TaxID=1180 RepID=UPI002FF54C36